MTPEEAELLFPMNPLCPGCDGTGCIDGDDGEEKVCPHCGGSGYEAGIFGEDDV